MSRIKLTGTPVLMSFAKAAPCRYDVFRNASKTLTFLEENRDRRFYLEINYMNNHRDARGEFVFADGFPVDPDKIEIPAYWQLPDWPEIRLEAAKFFSQTMKMDQMIGEVLDKLDELGLTENTMIVFVSDNGPPFPGAKMTLYDRGSGVPLIFRWPTGLPAGRRIEAMVNSIDIMPTILSAVKCPQPARVVR